MMKVIQAYSKDLESIEKYKGEAKKKKIRIHSTLRGSVGKSILPSFPQVIFLEDIFISMLQSMPVT